MVANPTVAASLLQTGAMSEAPAVTSTAVTATRDRGRIPGAHSTRAANAPRCQYSAGLQIVPAHHDAATSSASTEVAQDRRQDTPPSVTAAKPTSASGTH